MFTNNHPNASVRAFTVQNYYETCVIFLEKEDSHDRNMPLSSLESWCFSCKDCLYIISVTVKAICAICKRIWPIQFLSITLMLMLIWTHIKKQLQYLSCFHCPSDALITFKYRDHEYSKNSCKIYHTGGRKLRKGPSDVMDSSNNNFLSFVVWKSRISHFGSFRPFKQPYKFIN